MSVDRTAVLTAFDQLRERLATRGRWIQGAWARTSRRGRVVWADDGKATCWCLQGAINGTPMSTETLHVMQRVFIKLLPSPLAPYEDCNPITIWNDAPGRTHQQVLDLIDAARAAYAAGGEGV